MSRATTVEEALAKYELSPSGCWLWTGYTMPNGYGYASVSGDHGYMHRFFYRHLKGPIPEKHELDHLCRVRNCVNPEHLEPVTRSVNQRRGARGFALTGMCREGLHVMTDADIYDYKGSRRCRPCASTKRREARHRETDEQSAQRIARRRASTQSLQAA